VRSRYALGRMSAKGQKDRIFTTSVPTGAPPCPRLRVLVIEDDAPLRDLVVQSLTLDGMVVDSAADSAQALALCAAGPSYSVVVLDWRLGSATGREFAAAHRRLSASGAPTPILLLTGAEDVVDIAQEIGARGFLRKPFDLGQLSQAVERLAHQAPEAPVPGSTLSLPVASRAAGTPVPSVAGNDAPPLAERAASAPVRAISTTQHTGAGKRAAAGDERRRLLERMRDEAAAVQAKLPAVHAEIMSLAEIESMRRLSPEERNRRRDLRLQMEAQQLRLVQLREEFEALRTQRAS
jgi:DNA-binding response OmpR family regulator